jgi:prepilin-type N-terminal cleavage/methylation domain-containing protein
MTVLRCERRRMRAVTDGCCRVPSTVRACARRGQQSGVSPRRESEKWEMGNAKLKVESAKCKVQSENLRVQNAKREVMAVSDRCASARPLHPFLTSHFSRFCSPLATRHSPLATRHSPLATRHSPLATRHSPLATRHSLLATRHFPCHSHRGFTLVELLVVISIIAILTGITLFSLRGVQEDAKERRTRAIVARINEQIVRHWESYRTRPVPVRIPAGTDPRTAAQMRLSALRKLMRMELPDRKSDLLYDERFGGFNLEQMRVPLESTPTLWQAYIRRARQQIISHHGLAASEVDAWQNDDYWTPQYRNAEILYLILATMRDGDSTGLDFFRESEIGDVDEDGMPEILDAWGMPIRFLRWAPGYRSEIQLGDLAPDQDGDAGVGNEDAFDVMKVDERWRDEIPDNDPFLMFPLIYSAGRDGIYDIGDNFESPLHYENPPTAPAPAINYPNDPYTVSSSGGRIGETIDADENGIDNSADNITNHLLEVR